MTPRLLLFRRLALAGVLLALVVVVLGAWVRLSAAGLGCPDWPGCYGHLSAGSAAENIDAVNQAFPHRPFEYHKAIKEMVHRYFASGLGFLILVLAGLAISNRKDPRATRGTAARAGGLGDFPRAAGHVDRDPAAQAADRRAPSDRWLVDAVAAALAGHVSRARRPSAGARPTRDCANWRVSGWRCWLCRSCWAAGRAVFTRPSPARTFRPVRTATGPTWT